MHFILIPTHTEIDNSPAACCNTERRGATRPLSSLAEHATRRKHRCLAAPHIPVLAPRAPLAFPRPAGTALPDTPMTFKPGSCLTTVFLRVQGPAASPLVPTARAPPPRAAPASQRQRALSSAAASPQTTPQDGVVPFNLADIGEGIAEVEVRVPRLAHVASPGQFCDPFLDSFQDLSCNTQPLERPGRSRGCVDLTRNTLRTSLATHTLLATHS